MTFPKFRAAVASVLADASTSYRLRAALAELSEREPVDALQDAEILCALMRTRADEATARVAVHGDDVSSVGR